MRIIMGSVLIRNCSSSIGFMANKMGRIVHIADGVIEETAKHVP